MDNEKTLLAADLVLSMLKHTHDVYIHLSSDYIEEMKDVSQLAIDLANEVTFFFWKLV